MIVWLFLLSIVALALVIDYLWNYTDYFSDEFKNFVDPYDDEEDDDPWQNE